MLRIASPVELRRICDDARAASRRVGLVPTMGFLHAGHISLITAARDDNDLVVVSIFVNPLQFGPNEDLDRYPRDLDRDLAECEAAGADAVFAPAVSDMYPRPPLTTVHVDEITRDLCGAARPKHFDGVTTVVTKLFALTGPCRAYFGRKDAQQLAVVRRMVDDLNLPVEVVGCPLVRERDGLALSSRNAYLSEDERRAAPVLFRSLSAAADAVSAGERDPEHVVTLVRETVGREPLIDLEYVEVRDAAELRPITSLEGAVLIALAARLGKTRLIDNVGLVVRRNDVTADLGRRIDT